MTYTRRLSWFLAVSVLQLTCLTAQKSSFWLELGGGHALESKEYYQKTTAFPSKLLFRPGPFLGVHFEKKLNEKWSLPVGLMADARTVVYKEESNLGEVNKMEAHLFVNIPLGVSYQLNERLAITYTISPGYFFYRAARNVYKDSNIPRRLRIRSSSFYEGFGLNLPDLSSRLGIQYYPSRRIRLQGTFQLGMLPRSDKETVKPRIPEGIKFNYHWQILQLSAGWRLNRA
mgnify:CR=1 FL=1